MCKRIHDVRWNDLADPSLTSEYCDYLQFYRNNRDLSADAKAEVKTELSRANNNFRTVFVSNYADWLTYELNGSQRLNKLARKILTMYCPFVAAIRERLGTNPQYAEPLKRYNVAQQQRTKYLANLQLNIQRQGFKVPKEILDEVEYGKM
jgi:hypothetical protein